MEEPKRRIPICWKASEKMQTLFSSVCVFCWMAIIVAVTLKMILNIFF